MITYIYPNLLAVLLNLYKYKLYNKLTYATSSIYNEINMTFETIIQEIKNKPTDVSFDEETRASLIKVVEYIQNTDLDILHRISIQQLADVTGRHINVGFYLCGCKWHLLEPIYTYKNDDFSVEIPEDDIADFRQNAMITLPNGSNFPFDPEKIYISFALSDEAIKLKKLNGV